jgi:hypothetical protein
MAAQAGARPPWLRRVLKAEVRLSSRGDDASHGRGGGIRTHGLFVPNDAD